MCVVEVDIKEVVGGWVVVSGVTGFEGEAVVVGYVIVVEETEGRGACVCAYPYHEVGGL